MNSPAVFSGMPYMNSRKNVQRQANNARPKKSVVSKQGGMKRSVKSDRSLRRSSGVSQPESVAASYSQIQGSARPLLSNASSPTGDFRVRVRHTEYVQDVNGSVAFAATLLSINPGLVALFPWLSNMASLFESYEFKKLCFHFRTESASSSAGKALLAVDWDSSDAAPNSKQQMLQNRTKADGACWQNFDMPCDLQDLRKFGPQRFVRTGGIPANTDVKTYDVGNLIVATQGESTANAIRKLWVSYDVDLITPAEAAQSGLGNSEKIVSGGTVSSAAPFGTAPVTTGSPVATVNALGTQLIFPQGGQFFLEFIEVGTGVTGLTLTPSSGSTSNMLASTINGTSTIQQDSFAVSMLPGGTLTVAPTATTITSSTVRVSSYLASNA